MLSIEQVVFPESANDFTKKYRFLPTLALPASQLSAHCLSAQLRRAFLKLRDSTTSYSPVCSFFSLITQISIVPSELGGLMLTFSAIPFNFPIINFFLIPRAVVL